MYDIRQFKPTLYLVLLLGISGFALSWQEPGIWVLAMAAILLNAWLVRSGRFLPLPRLVANAITLFGVLFAARQVLRGGAQPIYAIGQFLILVQMVKLFEQRGNRDYAQLLVLGLLLMVSSAISTASLLFGLLLIGYLFVSLYCCLLFHLKVESEQAKASFAIPPDRVNPATLRQDQRHLAASMRRLTGLVAAVAITMAVGVFLFFPRGTGAGLLGQLQLRPSQAMTGFSEQVSFQQVARITQNPATVAYVYVWQDEKPVKGTQTLWLRGLTLDAYSGDDATAGGAWQWRRSPSNDPLPHELNSDVRVALADAGDGPTWRQKIILEPTGTSVLFAMPGPVALTPAQDLRAPLRFSPRDETLRCDEPLTQRFTYEVVSRNAPRPVPLDDLVEHSSDPALTPRHSVIDPRVEAFARRPEVSGANAAGPLAAQRKKRSLLDPLDEQIAHHVEQYLQRNFTYTLDLTDAKRIRGEDPMVAFLYDLKRGHCEYFAGAMTLMCQSLGMQARMVIGFKCGGDAFNPLGGYYHVRQSHAHAWVEVLTDGGWKTFDPTAAGDAAVAAGPPGLWGRLKSVFDYLEYKWQSAVVAYDSQNRDDVITGIDTRLANTSSSSSDLIRNVSTWISDRKFDLSSMILMGLVGLALLALVGAVAWFLLEKWRLRRRAARIGIDALPASDQMRLARQLGFYDDLMRVLARHQISRPRQLTPAEFADSLVYLPNDVYDLVRRLTALFYRIRFGRVELKTAHRRRLAVLVLRIQDALAARSTVRVQLDALDLRELEGAQDPVDEDAALQRTTNEH